MPKLKYGVCLFMTLLCIVGCKEKQEETKIETVTPIVSPVDETEKVYAPLTGLSVEKLKHNLTVPLAVMVNNFRTARPQSGLSKADIIYEVMAEGGITRLVAIFHSEEITQPMGPIRSIRPYLIEIGESHQAVLVHAGGSPDAYQILKKQKKSYLDEITNAGNYFFRDKARKAPHNLYAHQEKLLQAVEKKKYKEVTPTVGFGFKEEMPYLTALPASQISVFFEGKSYQVSYHYQAQTKKYVRQVNQKPHIDLNTKQPLEAENVIVLGTKHRVLDKVGRLSVNLKGEGQAWLLRDGKKVACTWERKEYAKPISFKKDGEILQLKPGKTHIHIVPESKDFNGHVQFGE